jgi:hypothetical protein
MPDLYSTVGSNAKKFVISQSDAGRELVISASKTNMTDADLYSVMQYITTAHGVSGSGDSAFTIAGFGTADGTAFVSGTTDVVYFRVQGTGDFTAADQDAGVSGMTVAVVAEFKPAL